MTLALSLGAALIAATPLTLAAPEMTTHNLEASVGSYYLNRFAQTLAGDRIKVTTAKDIGAVLGMERQRQLLGCGEDAATCLAELAQALGVDGILRGTAAKFDTRIEVSFKVVNAGDASTMGSVTVRGSSEAELMDALDAAALTLRAQLLARPVSGSVATSEPASSGPRWVPLAAMGASLAVAGVGAGLVVSSTSATGRFASAAPNSIEDPDGMAAGARTERAAGVAMLALGAVGAATALVFFLRTPAAVQPVALVGPGGGFIGVTGSVP